MIRPVAAPCLAAGLAAGVLSISALQGHPQIVVAGTGGSRHEQSRDLLPGAQRWTVSDFAAKREVIMAGLGWGGLPEHLITQDIAAGRLVPLEINGFPARHSVIHAIRRRDSPPGPVASELWTLLTSASPD
jgi:DNA-binding transcriptional LysR family regulator